MKEIQSTRLIFLEGPVEITQIVGFNLCFGWGGGAPRASWKFWGAPCREAELGGLQHPLQPPHPIALHYLSRDWASSHGCLGANGSVTSQGGGSVIWVQPVISWAWSLSPWGDVSGLR